MQIFYKQESPPAWTRTARRVGYLPWTGGVSTLAGGYLPWNGEYLPWSGPPTLAGGVPTLGYPPILTWPGGTYLGQSVPTLAYLEWGYLPWTGGTYLGVPPILTWPGGYLPWYPSVLTYRHLWKHNLPSYYIYALKLEKCLSVCEVNGTTRWHWD